MSISQQRSITLSFPLPLPLLQAVPGNLNVVSSSARSVGPISMICSWRIAHTYRVRVRFGTGVRVRVKSNDLNFDICDTQIFHQCQQGIVWPRQRGWSSGLTDCQTAILAAILNWLPARAGPTDWLSDWLTELIADFSTSARENSNNNAQNICIDTKLPRVGEGRGEWRGGGGREGGENRKWIEGKLRRLAGWLPGAPFAEFMYPHNGQLVWPGLVWSGLA